MPRYAPSPLLTGEVRIARRARSGANASVQQVRGRLDANSRHLPLDDDSLPNCVEDDFRCVVQIEFLHEIRSVGLDG